MIFVNCKITVFYKVAIRQIVTDYCGHILPQICQHTHTHTSKQKKDFHLFISVTFTIPQFPQLKKISTAISLFKLNYLSYN